MTSMRQDYGTPDEQAEKQQMRAMTILHPTIRDSRLPRLRSKTW